MPKTFQSSQLMQQIASLMPHYCDRCGFKHTRGDLEIVNQEMDKVVCKLECINCKNVYLFHVNSPSEGMLNTKRASIKTDISGEEIKKFSNTDTIENDEVLDVFIAVQDINDISDFNGLFEED